MQLLRFLFVGLVAGWVIGKIVRGRGFGLLGNIVVGGVGSLIGGYLYGLMGVPVQNAAGAIVMAIVGAIALFLVLSLIKPGRRKSKANEDDE